MTNALALPSQEKSLEELEAVVDVSFHEAATALREIKERGLYIEQYGTWKQYCRLRWERDKRIIDYRIQAATVIDELVQYARTKVLPGRESQARALMEDVPEESRVEVWDTAVDVYGTSPTAAQIAIIVGRVVAARTLDEIDPVKRQVYASKMKSVIEKMETGQWKPRFALEIVDALSGIHWQCRADMLRLGASDPKFIREMGNQHQRRTHETYDEIVTSGYLQFGDEVEAIPVERATLRDLRRLLKRKQEEHIVTAVTVGQQQIVLHGVSIAGDVIDGQQVFKITGKGNLRITMEWSA